MKDRFEKQAYEEFTISVDFSKNMESVETISSQTVTAVDSEGTASSEIVTDQGLVTSDGVSKVSVKVRAGETSLSPYKLTFRCVTSTGNKWEHDVFMRVIEK